MNAYSYAANGTDSLREAYLDSMREVLPTPFQRLSNEHLSEHLRQVYESLSPAEQEAFSVYSVQNAGEDFFRDLGRSFSSFGNTVAREMPNILRVAAPIAQIAAPAIGTAIGGPFGGMLGGLAGNLLGSLAPQQNPAPAVRPQPQNQMGAMGGYPLMGGGYSPQYNAPRAPAPASNPATAQLMALMQNPQLIQALLGQLMGNAGGANVTRPNNQQTTVPFPAMMNALSELAERAAMESVKNGAYESEAYLTESNGSYSVADPSNREQRAEAVVKLLNEDYEHRRNQANYQARENKQSSYDPMTEWFLEAGMIH